MTDKKTLDTQLDGYYSKLATDSLNVLQAKRKELSKLTEIIEKYPEMLDFVKVIEMGRQKYADENWLQPDGKSMSLRTNCDSLFHHIARKFSGEVLDESGLDHDLHIACRALMSYTRKKRGIKHVDDKLNTRMTWQTKDPKELNDCNCLSLDDALVKYKGSQYSKPTSEE